VRFFLIDRITSLEPGRSGVATKNVALSEDFFADHFPLKPLMPGVLMIEGMAQLSGLVLEEGIRARGGPRVKALMSIVEKAKFRRPVGPGERLEYRTDVLSVNNMGGRVAAQALAGDQVVADCCLVFSFQPYDDPAAEAIRSRLLSLWTGEVREGGLP